MEDENMKYKKFKFKVELVRIKSLIYYSHNTIRIVFVSIEHFDIL